MIIIIRKYDSVYQKNIARLFQTQNHKDLYSDTVFGLAPSLFWITKRRKVIIIKNHMVSHYTSMEY